MRRTNAQRMFSAVSGALVFTLFSLAFAGVGVAISVTGYRRDGWTAVAFGAIFELLGFGIIAACVGSVVMLRRRFRREAAHPAEPWLWDSDGSAGIIPAHSAGAAVGAWLIALLWNIPTIGSVIAFTATGLRTPIELIIIPFLLVGAYLVRRAVRSTLSARKYGQSTLRLSTVPGQIGGRLQANIIVAKAMTVGTRLRLRLTCARTTGSGDGRTTRVVWEDEMISDASGGSAIPVDFAIPPDQPETTPIGSGKTIVEWKVTASAESPAGLYESRFIVPIYSVPDSQIIREPLAGGAAASSQQIPVSHPGIRLTPLAGGGCRIDFAAGRNRALAWFLTGITAVLIFAASTLPQSSPPIWAEICVCALAMLLTAASVNAWLASATITVRREGLHIERGVPLMKIRRDVPVETIRAIKERSSGQMGETFYYTLVAQTDSKTVRIAGEIRNKSAANWVAAEIRAAMNIDDARLR